MIAIGVIAGVVGTLVAILAFYFSASGARFRKFCFSTGKGLVDWLANCTKGRQPLRVTVKVITMASCAYCQKPGPTWAVIMEDCSQVNACQGCVDARLSSGEWITEKS